MRNYTPYDWHWQIGEDETKFWSSAAGAYITELPEGAGLTRIDTEENLNEVLKVYGLPGPKVMPADVHAERDRRLALGFEFTFPDARGTHLFGTTPGDMVGWQDVTTWATVQAVTDNLVATLEIQTETGSVVITAPEWFAVLNAATSFRQPIWLASFILQSMPVIPADFRENSYWSVTE